MNFKEQLRDVKRQMVKQNSVTLRLPNKFAFKEHDVYDFEELLSFFNWEYENRQVKIDLTNCKAPNYQALSLLVLYAWKLKDQGCTVSFIENEEEFGASSMWRRMGAKGIFPVLFSDTMNFKGNSYKPLFAVRNNEDFKKVIKTAETYLEGFNVEYMSTLRYVLSELLYNTMEHGCNFGSEKIRNIRIPSIVQFTWYQKSNEIHFIIADCGIGIKKHIEQTYPGQESDEEAIRLAIRPQVSGTFGKHDPYKQKNNAGMGLFLSTNIIRRLKADMHILSGNGLLHISPRDITGRTLNGLWPGTLSLVTIQIENDPGFVLQKIMQEFRAEADKEQRIADSREAEDIFYLSIRNYFGSFAEDKESAIKFRDGKLFPAIEEGKNIRIDFDDVISAPHSFLSALLASPIKSLGMVSFKRIKIINASLEIRETIDFIFDDNT
ncbi:TPA: DUF4325 domain-containing protein [Vibrio cholerae]|uniref:STAS-like domain-containing protein n=1 Tax=Vibrio cholerae TaxID=666 RepID=UPI0011D87F09|nr:DUF4325 domain-containing protein [Vibrio cholerae]TYA71341.1 DUF4325 domain-containing protein [Vibrio cholerae]GIB53313.1 hypothetical protein VCSRO46_3583 [Vibrio cholerae]